MCDTETYYQQMNPVEVSLRDYHTSCFSRTFPHFGTKCLRPAGFFFSRGEIVPVLYIQLESLFRGFI